MDFEEYGYTVSELLDRAEVLGLQQEIAAHMDRVAGALYMPLANTAPDAGFDERIERIAATDPSYAHLLGAAVCTDAHRADAFTALARDPRLMQAAEGLLGAPVGDITLRVRGNSSAMGEHRHAWHSDVSVDDGQPCAHVKLTAWIPLVDAGPDNGGLEVAQGRRSAPMAHDQSGGRFRIPDEDLADAPKARITCPAGSVLFMDRYTPHRALPNTSGKTRWSLVMWMKPKA